MKTKTLTSMVLSGKNLEVVVKLNQTISETNDYSYHVMVKETRNSYNLDNTEYVLKYGEYEDALHKYIEQVEQTARHIAILSL
jgi:hypothetical protein